MAKSKSPLSSAAVLCSIVLVACMLMTLCYQATAERIEENRLRKEQAAMLDLLPEADSFAPLPANLVEGVSEIYEAANKAGWVVISSANGYRGKITVMTAIDASGEISGVKILDISEEDAGIAARVNQNSYLSQYAGAKSISSSAARSGAKRIDAVSGATSSSAAVFSCVSLALMQVHETEGGDI
ncbi:MAG: FMN-binding protein [Firmicutes bacterium]|nr:FMN-binding protein [Bacillota bacterium]